jgi:hypothetical protein
MGALASGCGAGSEPTERHNQNTESAAGSARSFCKTAEQNAERVNYEWSLAARYLFAPLFIHPSAFSA